MQESKRLAGLAVLKWQNPDIIPGLGIDQRIDDEPAIAGPLRRYLAAGVDQKWSVLTSAAGCLLVEICNAPNPIRQEQDAIASGRPEWGSSESRVVGEPLLGPASWIPQPQVRSRAADMHECDRLHIRRDRRFINGSGGSNRFKDLAASPIPGQLVVS